MYGCDAKITISNVILATDFTDESAQAIQCARELSEDYNARVHVVHVVDLFPFSLGQDHAAQAASEQRTLHAEERMKEFMRSNHLDGGRFDTHLLSGEPFCALEKFSRECHADLIVLGSRGDTGLQRLFEGSAAEEIFRTALCPVMVVGPRARTQANMFDRLFFATDMGRISRTAVPYIEFFLAMNHDAKLFVGHFTREEESNVFARHQQRKHLEHELSEMLGAELRPHVADLAIETCAPEDGMLQMVEGCSADILILGVRSGGSFTRAATHAPNSIAARVISGATCPVLTVRGE